MSTSSQVLPPRSAVLDDAHVGDIKGALGTIAQHDTAARTHWWARFRTLLAILGPGLIVMVGDNDAGAFGTYTQAGQNYGTTLLWTLLLLVPVLYVNQEMVLRLGVVTGVGHARLIFERFGKFWGAFSVIDLFLLNALTLVTEFIGITLATGYLGLPKVPSVVLAGALIVGAAATMGLGAVAFGGATGAGTFQDAGTMATALENYGGRVLGDMFAVALLDASIIGAFAVSLSTAYAIGDCFKINHSLHRGVGQ